jgi:hypothetical protein
VAVDNDGELITPELDIPPLVKVPLFEIPADVRGIDRLNDAAEMAPEATSDELVIAPGEDMLPDTIKEVTETEPLVKLPATLKPCTEAQPEIDVSLPLAPIITEDEPDPITTRPEVAPAPASTITSPPTLDAAPLWPRM